MPSHYSCSCLRRTLAGSRSVLRVLPTSVLGPGHLLHPWSRGLRRFFRAQTHGQGILFKGRPRLCSTIDFTDIVYYTFHETQYSIWGIRRAGRKGLKGWRERGRVGYYMGHALKEYQESSPPFTPFDDVAIFCYGCAQDISL